MRDDLPAWRSLLFVPVTAEKFVRSGADRGADGIILDLENAVAPSEKERARTLIADAIPQVARKGAALADGAAVRVDDADVPGLHGEGLALGPEPHEVHAEYDEKKSLQQQPLGDETIERRQSGHGECTDESEPGDPWHSMDQTTQAPETALPR